MRRRMTRRRDWKLKRADCGRDVDVEGAEVSVCDDTVRGRGSANHIGATDVP